MKQSEHTPAMQPSEEKETALGPEQLLSRGMKIYKAVQKDILEANQGRAIAVHVPSGDWKIEDSSGQALRAIRREHATGQLWIHTIGASNDYGLARRMGNQPRPAK